jgi:oligoribonuclease
VSEETPPETSDRLVWLDLEMTGLDVEHHVIVEVACVVTDNDLNVLDEGIDLVVHQPPEALEEMNDFVRAMHTRSDLISAITASEISLADAGAATLDYVRSHVSKPRTAPLCGNSIGTDRRFLDRHLPELEEYLHYRSIDVSSIKELAGRWYPEAYAQRPDKAEGHRAMADILESIEELRYYRSTVFRSPDEN